MQLYTIIIKILTQYVIIIFFRNGRRNRNQRTPQKYCNTKTETENNTV